MLERSRIRCRWSTWDAVKAGVQPARSEKDSAGASLDFALGDAAGELTLAVELIVTN